MTRVANRSLITVPGLAGWQIPASLVINGVAKDPVWRYRGRDATPSTWPAWGYGDDLGIIGSGSDPVPNSGSPCLGDLDGSVKYGGKSHYGGSLLTDPGTKDFVVEIAVFFTGDNNKNILYAVGNPGDGTTGMIIQQYSTYISLITYDAGLLKGAPVSLSVGWNHIVWFMDRSGYGCGYVNGVHSGVNTDITANTDIGVDAALRIGGIPSQLFPGRVAYIALWAEEEWLDTHLQGDVAKERFTIASGHLAAHNHGALVPSTL